MSNDNPMLLHTKTKMVMPWEFWEETFYKVDNPCMWYGCPYESSADKEECCHPNEFDPDESFLVEVERIDHEDGYEWERL